jgi:CBS domain containing-hemolysin-like protein
MIDLFIYIAISAVLLFVGYLVSVFSDAIYVDPEEIRTFFPDMSRWRRDQMEKFISNPRAFMQVAFVVRVTAAIALGILAYQVAQCLDAHLRLSAPATFFVIFIIYWIVTLVFFIYLPRRMSPERAKPKLIRFLPLVNLLYIFSRPTLNLLGRISARKTPREVSEDEKDDIVERAIETLAESAGITSPIIEEDEKEMIHQIFQLDVTEAEEIMVPRIHITGIPTSATLEDIQRLVLEHGYSRYPVFKDTIDDIIGIINVKDLLVLDDSGRENFVLTDFVRTPLRVGQHKKIDQLLADFKRTKTHMALVLDEFGGTAGVVTLEDILEEIVGEIEDEHDPETDQSIVRTENGSYEVDGACPLEDLAEELDIEIEQDEFETVGGMIYDMVGSVPHEGVSLTWQNCRLKVLEVDGQRIKKVLVIPTVPPREA